MSIDVSAWSAAVRADKRISSTASRVAAAMARDFDRAGFCSLSHERLADEAQLLTGTHPVRDAIVKMEKLGWLQIERPANRQRRGMTYRPSMPLAVSEPGSPVSCADPGAT